MHVSQTLTYFYWPYNQICCASFWLLSWGALCLVIINLGIGANGPSAIGISLVFFIIAPFVVCASQFYIALARQSLLDKPVTKLKSPLEFERTWIF